MSSPYEEPTGPQREQEVWQMWCRLHPQPLPTNLRQAKVRLLRSALEFSGGNISMAARVIGLSYPNFTQTLKRLGLNAVAALLLWAATALAQLPSSDTLNARFLQMIPVLLPSEQVSHQLTQWKETGCLGCPDSILVVVALDTEWDSITTAIASLQTRLDGCQAALAGADTAVLGWANCRGQVALLERTTSIMELQLGGLTADTTLLRTQLRTLRADSTALRATITRLKTDSTTLRATITRLKADSTALRTALTKVRADSTILANRVVALKADTTALGIKYRDWTAWGLAVEAAAQYQNQGWFWGSLMSVPWYLQPPPKPEP